jgi:hypothetical protein
MIRILACLLFSAAATLALAQGAAAERQHQPKAGPKPTQALTDEIAAQDQRFFGALFNDCDTKTLGAMVTSDFEMYHDKGGQTSRSGAELVKSITAMCERQKTGEDYRARRELVTGSVKVYPMDNYGAVQVGEHRFYQLLPGKPEKLVEVSLFTHLWKKDGGAWKLARVLSYDHRLTQ